MSSIWAFPDEVKDRDQVLLTNFFQSDTLRAHKNESLERGVFLLLFTNQSKEESMKKVSLLLGAALLLATAACHSTQVRIPTDPIGPNEKTLGSTEGSSVGMLLFGFIPINQNERFTNAYNQAVQKAGGTRLTDVTISERWWWGYVLNGYVFKVQGTAVANK